MSGSPPAPQRFRNGVKTLLKFQIKDAGIIVIHSPLDYASAVSKLESTSEEKFEHLQNIGEELAENGTVEKETLFVNPSICMTKMIVVVDTSGLVKSINHGIIRPH